MTSTSARFSTHPERVLEEIHRAEWGRLLSLLVARTRRLDLAEDALAEAFARASARWPADGVPANPAGWLYTTAHRQIVGRLRAEAIAGRKAHLLAVRPDWAPPVSVGEDLGDDRLHLILLCCHPALPSESRSALALRLVIGMPTEQVARLFLVSTPTMAARLTRAKQKIVRVGIPLGDPVEDELDARLDEVCRTIYLAFTAGYTPGAGSELVRVDLAGEAVRLAAVLQQLVPQASQVRAMLALVMLQHSRRSARERDGRLVTLADQDRSTWHHDEIRGALSLIASLPPGQGYAEELRLQALIAAEHVTAPTAAATQWAVIAHHYAALESLTGSAIVRLNRAVAVAEADGPRAGLLLLAELEHLLSDDHRLAAVRGELASRLGDIEAAGASFQLAIDLCANEVEREHLHTRLADVHATDR